MVAGGGAALLARPSLAAVVDRRLTRQLSFYSLHTGESLTAAYWHAGAYVPQGLADISYHLRDFRTGGIKAIDPHLLDVLHDLVTLIGTKRPLSVISGYRSPATNAMLAKRSAKVAVNSFHIRGQAIDIRIERLRTTAVRDVALAIGAGGVGYYPESDFVHLDTGPVRAW
jgi:uncharacterized protein YcbK (DUF882 family)